MNFRLIYHPNDLCQVVVRQLLHTLGISFTLSDSGELTFDEKLSEEQRLKVDRGLKKYGIALSEKGKGTLAQAIKDALDELIFSRHIRTEKVSAYLSEKLSYSYSHLSNVFSEETYTSIENFIILRKIEYAKRLMLEGEMSLTEIAHKLDYSSVAHLSGQFKKTTGLTPTAFLRILKKRNSTATN